MGEDEDFVRDYAPLVNGEVPRFDFRDVEGLSLVQKQQPVILTNSDLVEPAMQKWSIDYLAEHLGQGPFAVMCNRAEPGKCHKTFKYFDEKKLKSYTGQFSPPTTRLEMSFEEFLHHFNNSERSKTRHYFQHPLTSSVGKQLAADFTSFNWPWLVTRQKEWGWGPLTSNLLLIGQAGNITPCHYDEQHNLYCQLRGSKKFLLFGPECFPNLYPYPVHHPHDRQSQVDFNEPDFVRFPRFGDARGMIALLDPGDILYIPIYWWHHVVNVTDTVGLNFWHKCGGVRVEYPLQAQQKVRMVRNMEKMLLEATKDPNEVGNLVHWLVDGRF